MGSRFGIALIVSILVIGIITSEASAANLSVTASPAGGLYNTAKSVTLTPSSTATIYYTLDGSTPTTSSTQYTAPISISTTKTLKYFATNSVQTSIVYSQVYTIDTVLPSAVISSPAKNANLPVNVPISVSGSASDANGLASVMVKMDAAGTYDVVTPKAPGDYSSWTVVKKFTTTGAHSLTVRAIDNAQNIFYYTINVNVFLDTTPPVITANPAGGAYSTTQNVVLSSNEPATIYYTTNGITPTNSSAKYSSAIPISANTTLQYYGVDQSGNPSTVQSQTYTFNLSVTASPAGGLYNTAKSVTLTPSSTATIYYTLDGSTPTTSSTQYTAPISISTTKTLKYFATNSVQTSIVYSQVYTIDTVLPSAVISSPAKNANLPVNVPISVSGSASDANGLASVMVKMDAAGTYDVVTPKAPGDYSSWTVVKKFTTTGAHSLTVRAIDNAQNIFYYTINVNVFLDTTPPVITANPAGGAYSTTQNVVLSSNEPATIYYTTNGITPTNSSAKYSSAIPISANTTLQYYGVDQSGNPSTVQSQTYTNLNLPTASITQPTTNQVFVVPNVIVNGTATAGTYPLSGVLVSLDAANATLANGTATWTKTFTGLSIGAHTITAQGTDVNGSVGATTSVSFDIESFVIQDEPPIVNAGSNQIVFANSLVQLSGTATDPDGDPMTFQWTQVNGTSVTLANSTTLTPSFTAPQVNADTNVAFRLNATDSYGTSSKSDVVVTIKNNLPTASITQPTTNQVFVVPNVIVNGTATAGTYPLSGVLVSLDAANATLANGTATWTKTFTGLSIGAHTITAQGTDVNGSVGATTSVSFDIESFVIQDEPPIVNAGSNQIVFANSLVQLSGTATDPDGDPMTFQWTQVNGTSVTLANSTTLTPSFTAPQVNADTNVAFRLNATDSYGASSKSDVVVTIKSTGSFRNVNVQTFPDNVANYLVTSSADVNSTIGLNSTWIETKNSSSNTWVKRIENTPDSDFNNVTCGYVSYTVPGSAGFADKNGCTAVPWGFEIWGCWTNSTNGKVACDYSPQAGFGNKKAVDAYFDNSVTYEGAYSTKITGLYSNSTAVMAIPSYPVGNKLYEVGKPDIVPGETYRMELMVKLQNVKGTGCVTVDNPPKPEVFCGFRIYQTFFDSNGNAPKYVYYDQRYNGTSDWFKVTFDAKAAAPTGPDSTLVRGDPAIELAGQGTVWVDALRFYSLDSASPMDLKRPDITSLNVTSTSGTVTYFAPGKTNTPVNVNSNLMYTEGTGATGTYVYMWPNSVITISKWTHYTGPDNPFGLTADIAYRNSYGGIATVTASVNGTNYPLNCSFLTTSTAPKVFSCDLKAAGIDTAAKINNLTLKVQLDSSSNGSIDSIKLGVHRKPITPANTWVPVKMTWFTVKSIPDWRIGFTDANGNVFYSK